MSRHASLVLATALLCSASAFAQTLTTFSNGTIADANLVNGNFSNLRDAVQAAQTTATGAAASAANLTGAIDVNSSRVLFNRRLHFPNDVVNRKVVLFEGVDNDHQFYGFGVNAATLRYQVDGLGANHIFYAATAPSSSIELMRIQGNGNVGIGVTPASNARLQIAAAFNSLSLSFGDGSNVANNGRMIQLNPTCYIGSLAGNLQFFTQAGGALQAYLTPQGNFFCAAVNPSSRRFKENVAPMDDALELALQLRPVTFDWNEEHRQRRGFVNDIGFIAEEVQTLLPNVVATDAAGQVAGIDYARLMPVAIGAVQQQQTQIKTLREENAALKTRVAQLESLAGEVAALKAALQPLLAK